MNFSDFRMHDALLKAVSAMGFEKPTPIQARAIPPALEGKDILGSAQTGSGKTVAFAIPLLNGLFTRPAPAGPARVRALVLAPVRELAAQVEATLRECGQFGAVRAALIIGGSSWEQQVRELKQGAQIVVATPGRLLDHLRNHRGFDLRAVDLLVIDEADRMLDMGFLPDVRRILEQLPRERQTLMYSATVPPEIERLVSGFMREPVRVQIDPHYQPAEGIRQSVYPVSEGQKYSLLAALLRNPQLDSALVFTETKRRADVVGKYLQDQGFSAAVMHADLSQSVRNRTLQDFRDQKTKILVATDIAARGLDIRHVSHVVNYDVPSFPENYLHRIGRTARAFTVGDAYTLMTPQEKGPLESIELFIKKDLPRLALEGFRYDVPPKLTKYKAPPSEKFRLRRRSFKRGSRRLF